MGISIVMEIDPTGFQDSEWEAAYDETLELVNAYEFMDQYIEKAISGSSSRIVVDRSRERELPFGNGEIGWNTFGDLKTMGHAEDFTLFRDMAFNKMNSSSRSKRSSEGDIYLTRVVDSDLF